MKITIYGIVVCLLSVLCVGCKKEMPPETVDKREVRDVVVNKEVVSKAIAKFDEKNGLNSHRNYDISINETKEEWSIHFDGKTKLPGNHALIIINKDNDEIQYFQGQ